MRGVDPSCSNKVTPAQEKGLMRTQRICLLLPTEYLYIYMHTFKYISSKESVLLSLGNSTLFYRLGGGDTKVDEN